MFSLSSEGDSDDENSVSGPSFLEEDTESDSTESDADEFEDYSKEPSNSIFIVFWKSLLLLLCHCLSCGKEAVIEKHIRVGSFIKVVLLCSDDHRTEWCSQPVYNSKYEGNICLAASILFSGNTYANISSFFHANFYIRIILL